MGGRQRREQGLEAAGSTMHGNSEHGYGQGYCSRSLTGVADVHEEYYIRKGNSQVLTPAFKGPLVPLHPSVTPAAQNGRRRW